MLRPPGSKSRPWRSRRQLLRLLLPALTLVAVLSWARYPLGNRGADSTDGKLEQQQQQLAAGGTDGGGSTGGARRSTAQVQVAGSDVEVIGAVTAGAAVHGFVLKEGPADPRNWHPDHKSFRQLRLEAFLAERERLQAGGQLPPPLPIYTGCQVYVNHLYKVLFLRHAKTASSSLFCHFGGCKAAAANGTDADAAARKALSFELFQAKSVDELEKLWAEYFVVTFVRNPYQRAVSSYKMMMRQLAPDGPGSASYSWNKFCADPTGFADECMQDEQCKKKGRNFVYVHIQPQHPCIVTETGGWAVDFIGRVENIDEDLGAILAELEKRRPPEAPVVKPLEGSLENVNGRGCNESATGHSVAREQYCDPEAYFKDQHTSCYSQVQHQYSADVSKLGFGSRAAASSEVGASQR